MREKWSNLFGVDVLDVGLGTSWFLEDEGIRSDPGPDPKWTSGHPLFVGLHHALAQWGFAELCAVALRNGYQIIVLSDRPEGQLQVVFAVGNEPAEKSRLLAERPVLVPSNNLEPT